MKKTILTTALLLNIACANEQNYIEIGGGFIKSKDNFSTESKETIHRYENADSQTRGIPYLEWYYGYELDNKSSIYTKSQKGELDLGYKIEINKGSLDFGLRYNLLSDEEWENPFLINTKRKETDTSEVGAYIGYSFDIQEDLQASLQYLYSKKSYDEEKVVESLKREGNIHTLSFSANQMLQQDFAILYKFNYKTYLADGDASSYDSYDFGLGVLSKFNQNIDLVFLGKYGTKEYDKINPIFNETIQSDTYGLLGDLKWKRPFSYKNTYVSFKVGYDKENANINFYDKEDTFSFISIGYQF